MYASLGHGEDPHIIDQGSMNVCSFVYMETQDAECL